MYIAWTPSRSADVTLGQRCRDPHRTTTMRSETTPVSHAASGEINPLLSITTTVCDRENGASKPKPIRVKPEPESPTSSVI